MNAYVVAEAVGRVASGSSLASVAEVLDVAVADIRGWLVEYGLTPPASPTRGTPVRFGADKPSDDYVPRVPFAGGTRPLR